MDETQLSCVGSRVSAERRNARCSDVEKADRQRRCTFLKPLGRVWTVKSKSLVQTSGMTLWNIIQAASWPNKLTRQQWWASFSAWREKWSHSKPLQSNLYWRGEINSSLKSLQAVHRSLVTLQPVRTQWLFIDIAGSQQDEKLHS